MSQFTEAMAAEEEQERENQRPKLTLREFIQSFSWVNAFNCLISTRCKPWDNVELDVLDAFKGISYLMTVMYCTSFYLIISSTINTWKILDFFYELSFSAATASIITIELFFCMSAFIGAY